MRGGDDVFPGTAAFLYVLIKGVQIARVTFGYQSELHQGRSHQLIAALGDPASIVGIVGLADLGHDAHIGRQFFSAFIVIDVADPLHQNGGKPGGDPLDRAYAFMTGKLRARGLDRLIQV